MSVLNAIRNALAALLAIAAWLYAARALAPLATPLLPGPEGATAVLGLAALLLPVVYKLIVSMLAAVRVGSPSPARSQAVSAIAGGAVLALFSGAGVFALTWLLEQAAVGARGAPAAQALVRDGVLHITWLKATAEMMAALFIGSWIGRRHARASVTHIVLGFAILGWALALVVNVLGAARSEAEVRGGFHTLSDAFSHGAFAALLPAAMAVELPLFAGAFLVGMLGAMASGGRRASGAGPRGPQLVLGGV